MLPPPARRRSVVSEGQGLGESLGIPSAISLALVRRQRGAGSIVAAGPGKPW